MGLQDVLAGLRAAGPFGRGRRLLLAALLAGGGTLPELVARTGVPRRAVEALLADLGQDAARDDTGHYRLAAGREPAYRAAVPLDDLAGRAEQDIVGDRAAAAAELERTLDALVASMPRGRRDLDHVPATGRTALRRALWLDARFDLEHAHVVCVGDHDLTSVAITMLRPQATVTVVDLDEEVLARIDGIAGRHGLDIRCRWADLRAGLPSTAAGVGHLVVTDPPYTPEGVRLFCTRGLQALADSQPDSQPDRQPDQQPDRQHDQQHGRIVLAYGWPEHQPALGLAVQQAVQSLQLVFEAVLPGFNAYSGAQAIGSRSDLYLLRPTAKSFRALPKLAAAAGETRIYSHGRQSVESAPEPDPEAPAGGDHAEPARAESARAESVSGAGRPALAVLAAGPPPPGRSRPAELAVDAAGDPGPWLLRVLLALDADRLVVRLPNRHPDLATEAGQRGLAELVGPKWAIRVRRGEPDPKHAVLEATAAPDSLPARLLRRSHGKLGNAWREALLATARADGVPLTKNQARQLVAEHGDPALLGVPVLELPRHQLAGALEVVRSSWKI